MRATQWILVATVAVAMPATADSTSGHASEPAVPAVFAPRVAPAPRVADLLQIVAAELEPVAALRREIATTRDPSAVLELQRRIETIKRDTEIAMLQAQIDHARREGRTDVAEELEQAVESLRTPRAAADGTPSPALPAGTR